MVQARAHRQIGEQVAKRQRGMALDGKAQAIVCSISKETQPLRLLQQYGKLCSLVGKKAANNAIGEEHCDRVRIAHEEQFRPQEEEEQDVTAKRSSRR